MDSSEEKPSTPKLPIFSIRASPEEPGIATPPHRSFLSVPFRWEKEPGKPLPCLTLSTILIQNDTTTTTTPKSLELPPRLLFSDPKLNSPTTVLHGPYVGRHRFQSSSFRSDTNLSFSSEKGSSSFSAIVLSKKRNKGKGWFGSLGRRVLLNKSSGGGGGANIKEVSGGSYVFPSSGVGERESDGVSFVGSESDQRIRRGGSFSSLPNPTSHFWGTIYEGFKHAVPWRSKKGNKVR